MSLKKVTEVKADKGFKIRDLAVYGAVILIIAVIFIAVFVTRDTSPLKGVKIYTDEVLVFEYNFTNGEYKNYAPQSVDIIEKPLVILSEGFARRFACRNTSANLTEWSQSDSEEPPAENSLKIKITANGGYNVVEINIKERAVKVTEADCGKRDCVYTAAITNSSGMIYCSPHKLRILPYDFEADDNIII